MSEDVADLTQLGPVGFGRRFSAVQLRQTSIVCEREQQRDFPLRLL